MRLITVVLALQASFALASDKWVALTPAGTNIGHGVLAADPLDPDTLYADAIAGLTSSSTMAKSTDGGNSWRILPFNAGHGLVRSIVVERSAPNRVTALVWDSPNVFIHRSSDGGMTWTRTEMGEPIVGLPLDIAVDPRNPNTLYAAHGRSCGFTDCIERSGGLSKSADGGRRWSALYTGVGTLQVIVDPFGSGTIYTVSDNSSRRSQNGGASWTELTLPGNVQLLRFALDPVLPGVLYASSGANLWRSDDRGDTWHQLGAPFPQAAAWDIAIDPVRRGVIVVGGGNGPGAAKSADGGATWQPLNDGLNIPHNDWQLDWIRPLFAANGKLYASGSVHGVLAIQSDPLPRRRAVRR